ncbi:MAG: amidohydrolase [Streptosporangiaceae bacterium]
MTVTDVRGAADQFLAAHESALVALRRDLHMHPELGFAEERTTRLVAERLRAAGLRPRTPSWGTGLLCDVGGDGPIVALRADMDALPLTDEKDVPYRSTVPGVCHACGHDVHTVVLLGAALFLADLADAGQLPGRVRLVFQPAEERMPGGALEMLSAGALAGVERVFALHCDPRTDVGQVGLRAGPITAAADRVAVHLHGPGGHTARPHLTADLVYVLSKVVTELPGILSRRVDPRAGMSLVWGRIDAGSVANAIPDEGVAEGTLRCLDDVAWHEAPDLLKPLLESVAAPYAVQSELEYVRGVPPTVNDGGCVQVMREAAQSSLGPEAVAAAEQSLGGEDFAWYLESVPGALARLGVRTPGAVGELDLHRGTFDADERAIPVGVRLMVATALAGLADLRIG